MVEIWPAYRHINFFADECHAAHVPIDMMNFGGSWGASKIFPDDKGIAGAGLYLISSIMEEAIASSQIEGAATTRDAAKADVAQENVAKGQSQRMILQQLQHYQFHQGHAKEKLTPEIDNADSWDDD